MKAEELFITRVTWVSRKLLVLPDWAIKLPFSTDEEEARFRESIIKGVTPLHVAQREEEPDNKTFDVLDGWHRFKIIETMSDISKLATYNHGRLSLLERKALAVRFAWSFQLNNDTFGAAIKELTDSHVDFGNWSPVDLDEADRIIASLNEDLSFSLDHGDDDEPKKADKPKADTRKKARVVICPHCEREFTL